MNAITRLTGFLASLWGVLAAAAILFPGAAAVLELPIAVKNSQIAALYPAFGSTIAALALLFLTVYRDRLTRLEFARKVSAWAGALGLASLLAFVGIRTFALDLQYSRKSIDHARNLVVEEAKDRGVIRILEKTYSEASPSPTEFASERGDPWDLASLTTFIALFSAFTVAFGALGIHVYQRQFLPGGVDAID